MNDLAFLQQQLANPDAADLAKSITTGAGFVGYNLEPEAALILPYFAGWRSRLPTDPAAMGATQATWKAQLTYSFNFIPWGSSETSTGIATAPSATQFQAPYLQQALNGDVSYISMLASRGFDDPMNVETSNVLSGLLKLEEYISLGGNNAAISAPSSIVAAPSTLTTTATFAAGTWHVKVTALTPEGTVANATSNSNTGESNSSTSVAVVVPSGGVQFLDVQVPVVPGAVAYKFYIEASAGGGTFYLVNPATGINYKKITSGALDLSALGDPFKVNATGQTFVTVNHVQITTVGVNTQPTAPSTDGSANSLTFEGLIAWASKTTIYSQSVSHFNIDQDGAPLTTIGTGVLELDNLLEQIWTIYNMSPSLILGSAKTIRSLGNAIIKTAQVPTYRVDISSEQGSFQGGIFLGGYTNKFAATMLPGQKAIIPVWSHPYLPDGNLILASEDIPSASYRYSRKGKAFSLDVLAPYTYWELARTQLSIPFAILWSETLKCHHPAVQSMISGIRVDN